jgi:hypothetical protein
MRRTNGFQREKKDMQSAVTVAKDRHPRRQRNMDRTLEDTSRRNPNVERSSHVGQSVRLGL